MSVSTSPTTNNGNANQTRSPFSENAANALFAITFGFRFGRPEAINEKTKKMGPNEKHQARIARNLTILTTSSMLSFSMSS